MFSKIIDYFRDEEDNDPSFIRLTRNIVIFVIIVNAAILPLLTGLVGEGSRNPPAFIALSITLILECISLFLIFRGNILMTKITVPFALIAAVMVISLNTNGLKNAAMVGFPLVLMISSILLKRRSIFLSTPGAIIAVIIIAIFDLNGKIPFVPAGLDDAILIPILLFGSARVVQIIVGKLNESLSRARISEQKHKEENIELTQFRAFLEERVNQRTNELDIANRFNLRRARQFEAVAQVNRAITSIQDLNTLLPRITQMISEQFNIYHTGIFLLDDNREYAVLRAANSDGGKKMIAREHRLQVGQTGIVGFVTATGQPRIALDVGADAAFFDNPDLPNTHSEIALPLRHAGQVFGALDVQSDEPNAFNQDDIDVLTTLADQVAAAIKNTLTLEEARNTISRYETYLSDKTNETWKVMQPKSVGLGFKMTGSTIQPLDAPLEGDHIKQALAQHKPVLHNEKDGLSSLAIPIRLRGQTVGVINLRTKNNHKLTSDDADIAQAVTERLSLAIETTTLLQSTQHRADIERLTTEISSKISSSTRFETILQTAAEELSKALSGSDVLVQIEPISMELGMGQ
jgi:GAF domain-containing protein